MLIFGVSRGPELLTKGHQLKIARDPSFWYTVVEFKTNADGLLFGASTNQPIYLTSSEMSLRRGVTQR